MIKTNAGWEPTDADWAILIARQPADHFYAVITTGVVCRHGCPARTPLRKNVQVFGNLDAAVAAGFRGCKRCQPMVASRENSQSA